MNKKLKELLQEIIYVLNSISNKHYIYNEKITNSYELINKIKDYILKNNNDNIKNK